MDRISYVLVDEKGEPISVNEVPVYKPEDLLRRLRTLKPTLYAITKVDLTVARVGLAGEEFIVAGDFIAVESTTGVAQIAFNEPKHGYISLVDHLVVHTPFYRFFIINTAQAGLVVNLIIGKESLFKLEWIS